MHMSSAVSRKHLSAALALGSIAVLMVGLQPLLLGELLEQNRLSLEGVGLVAMGEILSLGLGVVLGDLLRSVFSLRVITVVAILAASGMDLVTANTTGDGALALTRSLAGLAEGLLLWGTVNLIIQGPAPDRVAGVFMVVQTLGQALVAAVLAYWVLPLQRTSSFGFVFLGALTAASLVLVRWQPTRLASQQAQCNADAGFSWGLNHVLLLGLAFMQLSAIGGLWAYLEPLSKYVGLDAQNAQLLVSGTLLMQVLGGCLGIVLVRRVSDFGLLAVAAVLLGGIALGMYLSADMGVRLFLALCGAFGLVWLMLTPFQVRIALQLDPSGRVAALVPGMQLLGCAFGPLMASQWVVGENAQYVLLVSAVFSLIALTLVGLLRRCPASKRVSFAGKVVLVVGASSGMGRGLAVRLAQEGACVVATARRKELLSDLQLEITLQGGQCRVSAVDALNVQAAAGLVDEIVEHYGRLDVIVLNAGGAPALDMREMKAADVTAYMRSNYDVVVNYLFPALEQMSRQGHGFVVHTNSLAGFLGVTLQGPYSAAKGALRLLIDTCRIEFGGRGIRFLSLYPGFVATAQTANDGMPAPLEISEAAAVDHMLYAMRSQRWDYLFPWPMRWVIRLARVMPKSLTLWVLRKELPSAQVAGAQCEARMSLNKPG
ncbi:short-chain dehydrogenase [Pseudomonas fluorescens]|uniref:SDR family NAD(P)-dependent oxidoreductase n=1 Tax=Pseudomonas lactucae TaxID=2813360 RepID=A0A9X0YD57_9PSED|nr:SDR family NAD(P)-dependent oxidoreductase [Pseudomonas lactucae]OPA92898.1 short-chain dehydrogenase [Pseudomonas fluorescens]MBN2977637.1 SDR family NAD(P)-dependent oxidoreductase [Pseudomonas lactucae]MBN2985609.1 SDR family NAD(P)-dependent oxidoreductase [Pseudomonas lactucae]OPB11652.1 short-chain dehydrogenase [Pseudomonas fluorescens]OPB22867.1 short-chain dehydrogenase [Pseudomonas fluorescens]